MKVMIGYKIDVFLQKIDDKGKVQRKNYTYIFEKKEVPLYQMRNEAIQKAKNLISFFENEMHTDVRFGLFNEAEIKKFKNFISYTLTVIFVHEGNEDIIYGGNGENSFEWLESEAKYYKENEEIVEMMTIANYEGDKIEVIKSNIEFFCSTDN